MAKSQRPRPSQACSVSPLLPISASPSLPDSVHLTRDEKRTFLARVVRLDLLDCLDESGHFDLARARRVLAGGVVQQLIVDEVKRIDRNGNTTVRQKIRIRLVDKVRAVRLDDAQQVAAERAHAQMEATARTAQAAAHEAQRQAELHQRRETVEKEVADRTWTALHLIFRDSGGKLLPGITPQAFGEARDRLATHYPRAP